MTSGYDVVVAGSGNAGLCAALSASEAGANVLLVEKASRQRRGGNSRFAALYRFPYAGLDDLAEVCPDLFSWRDRADVEPYPEERFHTDLLRASGEGTDEALMAEVSSRARETVRWLHTQGVRWEVSREGAVVSQGRYSWQDGYVLRPVGGVRGVLSTLDDAFTRHEGAVRYETALTSITLQSGAVTGAVIEGPAGREFISTNAVVVASGGFEADPAMRAKYLGPGWRDVKIRGTRHNTGEGLNAALAVGAARAGGWSRCHATMVHASAPEYEMGERAFPHAYPYGVLLTKDGERFVDEAPHSFAFTYASMGELVLRLPGGIAYQLFDARSAKLRQVALHGTAAYDVPHARGETLEEVAKAAGITDVQRFLATVEKFNAAVDDTHAYDPLVPDGRRTHGLAVDKSNWAERIDRPPFELYPVECGITFTFGGVRISQRAQVLDEAATPIPGLYACGEASGVFQHGYPGGSGLMAGAVFGRLAGHGAAMSGHAA